MATKKGAGSSSNGRDSAGRRLGIKRFGGEFVLSGCIILRQRGTKYLPGKNVMIGRDHTIFSVVDGVVAFSSKKGRTVANVVPVEVQ